MAHRKRGRLRILVVCDVPSPVIGEEEIWRLISKSPEWRDERDVVNALHDAGHEVHIHGVYDNIARLIDTVNRVKPDLAFPLCESFMNSRELSTGVISVLEMMSLPFTGAGSVALQICRDKAMTKKVVSFHEVMVPKFSVCEHNVPLTKQAPSVFPAIVKPLDSEASEGIHLRSVVNNQRDCNLRVRAIHKRYATNAIIEEYIPGREIYVGVIGNDRPTVLSPRELVFRRRRPGVPTIATYNAKWNAKYRQRNGIGSGAVRDMPTELQEKIQNTCTTLYQALNLNGYARMDLRISPLDEVYFIEANPNPAICRKEEFALSAMQAGYSYDQLISKIIELGLDHQAA